MQLTKRYKIRKGRIKLEKRIGIFLSVVVAAVIISGTIACAFAAAIRETDADAPADGNTFVLYSGEFQYLTKSEILARINEIRQEACAEGLRDPRNKNNNLTESDYVPIKWSSDLEWIAQTRAAEGALYMAHMRPNGTRCFTANHNGEKSWGEVLVWNGAADILYGISQWYSEKKDWVNHNEDNAETGHYTAMIDPGNTYVGIGAFLPSSEDEIGTVAGEFSYKTGLDETQAAAIGECDQVIEVEDSRLKTSVSVSSKIHIGKTAKAKLNMKAEYPDGVWPTAAEVKPYEEIIWSSSDDGIASISSDGQITGVNPGNAAITATVGTHSFSEEIQIEGHNWDSSYTVDQAATCTRDGKKSIHCSVCNVRKSGSTVSIPKLVLPVIKIAKPKAAKKAVIVKWNKVSAGNQKKISGIEIQYSQNKNFKTKTKIIKAKKTDVSKKIKKLVSKKKYYVRIRTWKKWNGKKYTSKWSAVKIAKTK